MEEYVRDQFRFPLYGQVRLNKPERYGGGYTPTRIYDRSTGNYAPYGWLIEISYNRFTGEFDLLAPVYTDRIRERIVVADAILDRY